MYSLLFTNWQAILSNILERVTDVACGAAPVLLPPYFPQSSLRRLKRDISIRRPRASRNKLRGLPGYRVPDIELVNQEGKKLHIYSDLIKGRVVAINTIFTTCTTICPIMGANFAKLSRLMEGEGSGKLSLISISVDPSQDTPERLQQWSAAFGKTGVDWTLLTGPKSDIERLLKALQVFSADKQNHAPVVLIGGGDAGAWTRASALMPPKNLADLIRSRLAPAAGESTPRP